MSSKEVTVTPGVRAALDAAAIPSSKIGPRRHERLTERERELYFWVLRRFASSGRPTGKDTRETAERLGLDANSALETLAAQDLVHLDRTGEIVVAYPFSGRPTGHRVVFAGGNELHAMCAIDALGIAPMFDEAIEIVSQDPLTGERIEVDLTPAGTGSWRPEDAVVVCGASGSGESCSSCCPVLNFFASRQNGERWLAGRLDVRGYVMTMDEAIEAGRAVFGDALASQTNAELPSAP
jgi:hypothetical protein